MPDPDTLARTERLHLRDTRPEDVDAYLRWQTSGEWRHYDAPWEGFLESLSPAGQHSFRENFLKTRQQPLPNPRQRATIVLPDQMPIGWVSRYGEERFPSIWYLGIDICEDAYLNQGLGNLAMRLWVNYLFQESDVHKLELHTWSINPRMVRVAEKLGFTHEGTERELIHWQGEWIHRLRFGLLRREWETLP